MVEGAKERLGQLKESIPNIFLFTGDTHGNGVEMAKELGIELRITKTASEKAAEARKIGLETTAAIGNGLIDAELLQIVRLGIVTLQTEGAHLKTLENADIVALSINDALDLLLNPKRLVATLRS